MDKNVNLNKTKHVLVENELNKLSEKVKVKSIKGLTKDLINKSSVLIGEKYFSLLILPNYLMFSQTKKYIKYFSGTNRINSWKSNEISEENIENITKLDRNFVPTFVDRHLLPNINLNGHCFIKNNISIPKKVKLIKVITH